MFLVCPKCLAAKPELPRVVHFNCAVCRHAWEAPDPTLARAYYAELSEVEIAFLADDGERFEVDSLPAVIGRDSEFNALQRNLAISRCHLELEFDQAAPAFTVHDLGAKGGTSVRGKLLGSGETVVIEANDEIRVSGVRLELALRLRTEASTESSFVAASGERQIDLTKCGPIAFIGTASDGQLEAVSSAGLLNDVLGAVVRANDGSGWRLIVLRRDLVRVNGDIVVERDLFPLDQLRFGSRLFSFNHAGGMLDPERPATGAALDVQAVQVSYGSHTVLANLSCTIPGGRLTAVLGQSGTGKTTLIKVLSGLRNPDSGKITVRGLPTQVEDYSPWAREQFALVPQHDVVHLELTVRQSLECAVDLRLGSSITVEAKQERVDRALNETGIAEIAGKRIANLSGGQRKRVNVAAELIGAPAVILLDEPTTGLDYATERGLIAGLRRLSRQGRTVVFVTHSLATIDAADHVIVLSSAACGASVLAEGPPARVKKQLRADDWMEVFEQVANAPVQRAEDPPKRTRPNIVRRLRGTLPRVGSLCWRYTTIWFNNALASAALFLGLPLLLGVLIRLAVSADGTIGSDRLLFGVIAAFWTGMNQSVREIVREKAIFIHEHANRVGCFAYLLSKVAFFVCVALPQAILLSAPLKWMAISDQAVVFSLDELRCSWLMIVVMFWAAGVLGCCLGLLFSSMCLFVGQKGETMAVLLVVLVILPQFLYSNKVLPEGLTREAEHYYSFTRWHSDAAVPEFLSFFTVSRYLFLPLDAVSRNSAVPVASKAIWFNGTILGMIGLISLICAWIILELFVVWQRRRH